MINVSFNGLDYEIKEVEEDSPHLLGEDDRYHFGMCNNKEQVIYLMKTVSEEQKKRVLTHELTHMFLNNFGMFCKESYSVEELCEFTAYNAPKIMQATIDYFG